MKMTMTTWRGYIYQWEDNADLTPAQNERAHDFMIAEINRLLPDDVTWYESTSEIILPIDMADTLEIDWQNILTEAYENLLKDEDNIIGEE
jgi:hypothetical protein